MNLVRLLGRRGMFIALLTLPVTMQAAVAADSVPNWDVTGSCRGAASAGFIDQTKDRLQRCLDSEQRTRKKLESEWSSYPAQDRTDCIRSIRWFQPTYTELAACLRMAKDARSSRSANPSKQ
jgi:hypothetical protein